jgi:hypothetical protein
MSQAPQVDPRVPIWLALALSTAFWGGLIALVL